MKFNKVTLVTKRDGHSERLAYSTNMVIVKTRSTFPNGQQVTGTLHTTWLGNNLIFGWTISVFQWKIFCLLVKCSFLKSLLGGIGKREYVSLS